MFREKETNGAAEFQWTRVQMRGANKRVTLVSVFRSRSSGKSYARSSV